MNIHFISIGGSVMHQLAIALKRMGYHISGSDDEIFEPALSNLKNEGILPSAMGWNSDNINSELDAVILGMHARAENPELLKAQELGLPVYSFPEYIYQASKSKTRVVVGGSHGKTTTTSMIMHVLRHANLPFDWLVGAKLEGFNQSVQISAAPVIVCEGDEYPASAVEKRPKFHFLFPHIAILTGIAWDHINVFPTYSNYLEQFVIFISKIEPGGLLIYNETDPELKNLVENNRRTDIRYLPYAVPENSIDRGTTYIRIGGETRALKVFGNHNLLNLHAAYFACKELGVEDSVFLDAISSFTGASRRLEVLAERDDAVIFRDFAHAPSKVRATIEAVKQQYPNRKLIAVFELHTYSSLSAAFMPQYAGSLDPADEACVFYSKHAMEIKKMPDMPAATVEAGFGKAGLAILHTKDELQAWLDRQTFQNCCIILMSSGTFDGLDLQALASNIFIPNHK
jgi:UDP-N-acetylmuramate: L-alanyl-gamma-D-glutamyl-meso-diaminopimelate ligase